VHVPARTLGEQVTDRLGFTTKINVNAERRYSLHAPELECLGKGKARAPCEFGCKVSIATPAAAPKSGAVRAACQSLARQPVRRPYAWSRHRRPRKAHECRSAPHPCREGNRGHNLRTGSRSGSAARSTGSPKPSVTSREMCRRAAVEPVIGHFKDYHRVRRNYLEGQDDDRIHSALAVG
jgi:IS5 family transposase